MRATKKMRPRIYVSGPLHSSGDVLENIQRAVQVGRELVRRGYAPYIPHLTHYADPDDNLGREAWLAVDLAWLAVSEGMVRLPGESRGADLEEAFAHDHGLPVFPNLAALPATQVRGDSRFHALLGILGGLHNQKQADYGSDADAFANVRASEEWGVPAWVGALLRAGDKLRRLQAFARRGWLANEGVEDSLLDLACYALIALVLYKEGRGEWSTETTRSWGASP